MVDDDNCGQAHKQSDHLKRTIHSKRYSSIFYCFSLHSVSKGKVKITSIIRQETIDDSIHINI